MINERRNRGGTALRLDEPERIRPIPKLVLTCENDPNHPRDFDQKTADYVGAEFVWLPEAGMPGHSHEMMLDQNNQELAEYMLRWLEKVGVR